MPQNVNDAKSNYIKNGKYGRSCAFTWSIENKRTIFTYPQSRYKKHDYTVFCAINRIIHITSIHDTENGKYTLECS